MNINKKLLGIGGATVALAAVAISWAFYSSTHVVNNPMSTGKYGDVMVETFTPDKDWEPGEEATKEVSITNVGNYDLFIRVKMDESWTYQEQVQNEDGSYSDYTFITHDSKDKTDFLPSGADDDLQAGVTAESNAGATDGKTEGDGSVVYKEIDLEAVKEKADEDGTVTSPGTSGWAYGSDGYWYYKTALAPQASTGSLLKSITLCKNTDMGAYESTTYYQVTDSSTAPLITDGGWTELGGDDDDAKGDLAAVEVGEDEYLHIYSLSDLTDDIGYALADYVLTITSETCQATQEAVDAMFGENLTLPDGVDWGLTATTTENDA